MVNLVDDERDADDGDERLDQYSRGFSLQSPSWGAAMQGTRKPASRWLHLAWTIPLAWMASGLPIAIIIFARSSFGGRQVAAGVAAMLLVGGLFFLATVFVPPVPLGHRLLIFGAISLGAMQMLLTLLVASSTV